MNQRREQIGLEMKVQSRNGMCEAERMPASVEILNSAERLSERANALAERMAKKLHPVMRDDSPRPCNQVNSNEYPPLFNGLRACHSGIEDALDSIEHLLNRTEL